MLLRKTVTLTRPNKIFETTVAIFCVLCYCVLLTGGETHERNTEKPIRYFYQPLDLTAKKQEIETCHQQLIERLDKPEHKLVLRIIDVKDRSAELLSIDSFICVFELACKMATELDHHKQKSERPVSNKIGPDARPVCQDAEN